MWAAAGRSRSIIPKNSSTSQGASEHEMTVKAKAMSAFYGSGPKLSYWNAAPEGTSGRQQFPRTTTPSSPGAGQPDGHPLWIAHAVLEGPRQLHSPGKYPIIHQAARRLRHAR
jgi:hypothetical protein